MGEAAALVAAFTWSATSVAMARLTLHVTPVAMSTLRLVIAALVLPFVLLASGQAHQLGDAPPSAIVAMIGSGLLAYAIGDTLYITALKRLGIQRAFPVTMSLFILLTVAGGILWLDEEFSWMQAAGGLGVGAGITRRTGLMRRGPAVSSRAPPSDASVVESDQRQPSAPTRGGPGAGAPATCRPGARAPATCRP